MIIANIKDAEKYCSINKSFKEVFDFLKGMTKDSKEGTEGNGYRVNFSGQYCDTADKNADGTPKVFEAHRKYIDIHYCISGSEGIGYNDVSRLTPTTEYDEENDYFLLSGEYQKVILREGDFCVVFPEDAHIPMMTQSTGKTSADFINGEDGGSQRTVDFCRISVDFLSHMWYNILIKNFISLTRIVRRYPL